MTDTTNRIIQPERIITVTSQLERELQRLAESMNFSRRSIEALRWVVRYGTRPAWTIAASQRRRRS